MSISEKINSISNFWLHYACSYQTIREKLNWSKKNNPSFFGDIIAYLKFSSEIVFEKYNPQTKNLLSLTGAIQMMYVQQDLLDELRIIFKLPHAIKNKYDLRQIRNELIGHPISWDEKGNLKSTVLWNDDFDGEVIKYVKYAREDNFVPEKETKYNMMFIIEQHKHFVNKQLDEIIHKINIYKKEYRSKIKAIISLKENISEFPNYLRLAQQIFEKIFYQSIAFQPDVLQPCYEKVGEHNRYKYIIELFIKTLRDHVSETVKDLDNVLVEKKQQIPSKVFKVNLISHNQTPTPNDKTRNVDYILSKLVERKHVCLPSDLLPYVIEDSLAIAEIKHMEKHCHDDLEYYSAFEYLCLLIGHQ